MHLPSSRQFIAGMTLLISTRSYIFRYIRRESGVPKFLSGTFGHYKNPCQKGISALRIKYRKIYVPKRNFGTPDKIMTL
ncbi:MAG: hypothetical protein BWK80_11530 [Desulfobacteraceae bacterium IS3]|nr:MAG: hypothetical protein BWK80_11530 [Desulfobacteraceae bacterium IS3]